MKRRDHIRTSVLIFCILFSMLTGCSFNLRSAGEEPAFISSGEYECDFEIKPLVFKKFGEHIYYLEDKFFKEEKYNGQNETMRKCFEDKDSEEVTDICLIDYIVDGRDGKVTDIQLYGREYIDGILVDDKPYYAQSVSKVKHFTRMFAVRRQHNPNRLLSVDPEKIFPKVAELACKNKHSMMMNRGNLIYGTYVLKFNDTQNYLYYEFTLNTYSTIKVNAKNGKIDYSKFKDGYPVDWAYD